MSYLCTTDDSFFLVLANPFNEIFMDSQHLLSLRASSILLKNFIYGPEAKNFFKQLQSALTDAPALAMQDESKPYALIYRASNVHCGDGLLQKTQPKACYPYTAARFSGRDHIPHRQTGISCCRQSSPALASLSLRSCPFQNSLKSCSQPSHLQVQWQQCLFMPVKRFLWK